MNTRNVIGADHPQHTRGALRLLLPALLVLAFSSIMVSGLATAADAQRGRGRGGMGAGAQSGMMRGLGLEVLAIAEELDLTEEQVTRLKNIRKSAPAKIMPKTQALMEARLEYRDLMADANADTKAIRAAHKRVLDAQAQVKSATFDLRLEVRDVLTPEQRAEVKKLVRQRARERVHRLRSPRPRREHWGRHGSVDGPFGPMGESLGHFDAEADFFGLGPGWSSDPDWSGDGLFWIEEDPGAVQEGEKL